MANDLFVDLYIKLNLEDITGSVKLQTAGRQLKVTAWTKRGCPTCEELQAYFRHVISSLSLMRLCFDVMVHIVEKKGKMSKNVIVVASDRGLSLYRNGCVYHVFMCLFHDIVWFSDRCNHCWKKCNVPSNRMRTSLQDRNISHYFLDVKLKNVHDMIKFSSYQVTHFFPQPWIPWPGYK